MLLSKPLLLFQDFGNTTVTCLFTYTSMGFEFVKERNHILCTYFIIKPFEHFMHAMNELVVVPHGAYIPL